MFQWLELLKEAQEISRRIEEALAQIEIEVSVHQDRIRIRMDGTKTVTDLEIDPELLHPDRKDELERWLLIGLQQATQRVDEEVRQRVQQFLPPGLRLPGFS